MDIRELNESMTSIKPSQEQAEKIEKIREAYKFVGKEILTICPQSRNQAIAITSLEESLHRAVKSIILNK